MSDPNLERRCPNCGHALLADELSCWQCGHRLQQEQAVPSISPVQRNPQQARRASALTVYSLLTLLLILSALLLTLLLGRQPRLQAADVPLPDGWSVVTDRQRTFTLYLPDEWELLDASDEGQRQIERLLAENPDYRQATAPLTGFVDDEEILFVARGRPSGAAAHSAVFLLVARSRLLNRLSQVEALALAQESDLGIIDARQVENYDKSHLALQIDVPSEREEGLICRQQFITGQREALLLALCSPPGQLNEEIGDLILSSVQRLAP